MIGDERESGNDRDGLERERESGRSPGESLRLYRSQENVAFHGGKQRVKTGPPMKTGDRLGPAWKLLDWPDCTGQL